MAPIDPDADWILEALDSVDSKTLWNYVFEGNVDFGALSLSELLLTAENRNIALVLSRTSTTKIMRIFTVIANNLTTDSQRKANAINRFTELCLHDHKQRNAYYLVPTSDSKLEFFFFSILDLLELKIRQSDKLYSEEEDLIRIIVNISLEHKHPVEDQFRFFCRRFRTIGGQYGDDELNGLVTITRRYNQLIAIDGQLAISQSVVDDDIELVFHFSAEFNIILRKGFYRSAVRYIDAMGPDDQHLTDEKLVIQCQSVDYSIAEVMNVHTLPVWPHSTADSGVRLNGRLSTPAYHLMVGLHRHIVRTGNCADIQAHLEGLNVGLIVRSLTRDSKPTETDWSLIYGLAVYLKRARLENNENNKPGVLQRVVEAYFLHRALLRALKDGSKDYRKSNYKAMRDLIDGLQNIRVCNTSCGVENTAAFANIHDLFGKLIEELQNKKREITAGLLVNDAQTEVFLDGQTIEDLWSTKFEIFSAEMFPKVDSDHQFRA